jgi:hypothetical protein
MMFPRTYKTPLPLFDGFHMLSRGVSASFMLSLIDITRGLTHLELKSLRVGMTASDWKKKMARLFGRMQ